MEKVNITANSHHFFLDAIMPYTQVHFSSPSASCGEGLSLSIPVLLLLCCCCIFGSSPFSLKSSLCLLFVLGCSAYFLCSSLVSATLFPALRPCQDSYNPNLLFSCSFSLKPPTCFVGYFSYLWLRIQSLISGFRVVSVFSLLSLTIAATRACLWDRQKSKLEVQKGSEVQLLKTEIDEQRIMRNVYGRERRNTGFTYLPDLLEDKDCNSEYVH